MTEKRFDGRAAIVTGGALGIGGGTARRLAADGAKVLIVDVVKDAAEANAKRSNALSTSSGGWISLCRTHTAVEQTALAVLSR
jgi:NAD(P)-dependent dehydrogenase (short-subunit alcohol dehydrogenase family)